MATRFVTPVQAPSARNGCKRPQIEADDVNRPTPCAFDLPDRLTAKDTNNVKDESPEEAAWTRRQQPSS